MSQDARAWANYLLDRWGAEKYQISNKKLNKLLYFAHGSCLARAQHSIIKNRVEAWQHGPVYRVVYESFSEFGSSPITSRASYFDYAVGCSRLAELTAAAEADKPIFDRAVSYYVHFSADQLEAITHEAGSPWCEAIARGAKSVINGISEEAMTNYFGRRLGRMSQPY